jgi:hypothetical protein
VAGADVTASRTATPGYVWLEHGERHTTGADGTLRLEDLALGETVIRAVAPGFAQATSRAGSATARTP